MYLGIHTLNKMNNFEKDRSEEKEKRRSKIKNKKKQNYHIEDDNLRRDSVYKKEIKKIKESYQEEEWEDWNRYYN
jgi:hypothetical protein